MSDFKAIIKDKTLRALAVGRSYSRGDEYFESGLVGPVFALISIFKKETIS